MAWQFGDKLNNGRYTIDKVLGRGRFGTTYRAKDQQGQFLVIKTPRDDHPELERLQKVFMQEALKLEKCRHPSIVKVIGIFPENGLCCIAMEYVAGTTLADREQAILSETDALNYVRQIGAALAEVHRNKFLHRDVCPRNIMVRSGKTEAVLIDFGLALGFETMLTETRTEEIAKGFAPPELYSSTSEKGAWTDIYMLGATLYELLTGEIPIDALRRKLDGEVLPKVQTLNDEISGKVSKAVAKAMSLDTAKRPQSIDVWFRDLGIGESEQSQTQTPVPSTVVQPSSRKWFDNLKAWQILGIILAGLGSVLGGLTGVANLIKEMKAPSTPPVEIPVKTPQTP